MTVGAKQDALPAPVVADAVPIPVAEAKTEPAAERIHSVEEMESEKVPTVNDAGYYRRYCFALWNEHQPEKGSGQLPADFGIGYVTGFKSNHARLWNYALA